MGGTIPGHCSRLQWMQTRAPGRMGSPQWMHGTRRAAARVAANAEPPTRARARAMEIGGATTAVPAKVAEAPASPSDAIFPAPSWASSAKSRNGFPDRGGLQP